MIKKLTDVFYERYSKYPEILQKKDRPYFCLVVKVDSVVYAIPLRHHITHKRSFITIGTCGLDFSKTVIIGDKRSKQFLKYSTLRYFIEI